MTVPTIRYAAHRALERLEWIERHVQARPDDRETRERLPDEIEELQRFIVRVIGGGHTSASQDDAAATISQNTGLMRDVNSER